MTAVQNLEIKKRNDVIQKRDLLFVFCDKSLFYISEIIRKFKNFIPNQCLPNIFVLLKAEEKKRLLALDIILRNSSS